MSRFAFVDESLRSGRYLLGCVVVDEASAGPLRRRIRKLLLPNERRLHIRKADRRQRLRILREISTWGLDARVYVCRHVDSVDAETARRLDLERIVADLQASGQPTTLFVEWREGGNDRDRTSIVRARERTPRFEFHHLRPTDDPLLWLPDCIAWAVGAGGEWLDALGGSVSVVEVA